MLIGFIYTWTDRARRESKDHVLSCFYRDDSVGLKTVDYTDSNRTAPCLTGSALTVMTLIYSKNESESVTVMEKKWCQAKYESHATKCVKWWQKITFLCFINVNKHSKNTDSFIF